MGGGREARFDVKVYLHVSDGTGMSRVGGGEPPHSPGGGGGRSPRPPVSYACVVYITRRTRGKWFHRGSLDGNYTARQNEARVDVI